MCKIRAEVTFVAKTPLKVQTHVEDFEASNIEHTDEEAALDLLGI